MINFIRIFLLTVLSFFILPKTFSQKTAPDKSGESRKIQLIWSDEFNYTGLPDSTIWSYEVGYIRNKESQYYTCKRTENTRVENGTLIIESLKEEFEGFQYTSGSINTLDKKSFEGDFRVEVRARLPKGKGIWPAIWMMGVNRKTLGWPKCSELDIMEFVGHTPNTLYATMHWADSTVDFKHMSQGEKTRMRTLHDSYHLYALERTGKQIKVFVDEDCILTFEPPLTAYPDSFTGPLYLLLNTAIGGSWGGEIDNSIFPQQFVFDYVRVYSLAVK